MHEFAICENILSIINNEFNKQLLINKNIRLKEVKLKIGGMRQIIPEYLYFAYKTMTNDTQLFGSELNIKVIPIKVSCENCNFNGDLPSRNILCPKCKSSSIILMNGKELFIESIEIEEEQL